MRTSNPALNDKIFIHSNELSLPMTIEGTVNKSLFLILLVFISGYYTWTTVRSATEIDPSTLHFPTWYLPLLIIAFVIALIIIFKKTTAPFLTPIYALLEGAILGALSAIFETLYPGIVMQAILGTLGTFVTLLLVYKSGLIKVTENFKLGVVAATGGVALIYLIDLGLSFAGKKVPFIHESGPMGIAVSVFIVAIAAFNLVLDFDFIENGAKNRAPKYMEWYAAFGLLVTLIWLYVEILKLLAKSKKK